jgi:transcription antitermination factor NusG
MSYLIPPSFDEPDIDMPTEVPKWFAVRANPRSEKRAALSIMEALKPRDRWNDLAVYLPVETYFALHARKKEIRTRPLLAGYVFLCIREADMHIVRLCDGVADFVRGPGGFPSPIHFPELIVLRKREEAGEWDATRAADFGGLYKEGDPVKVAVGKYADFSGNVVKMTAADKAKVVLSLFGRTFEREFKVTELKAA